MQPRHVSVTVTKWPVSLQNASGNPNIFSKLDPAPIDGSAQGPTSLTFEALHIAYSKVGSRKTFSTTYLSRLVSLANSVFVHVIGTFVPVENGIFTYWQLTVDMNFGVFRRLAVLDGVVELSKKKSPSRNCWQRELNSPYSDQTWPPKAGGPSPNELSSI